MKHELILRARIVAFFIAFLSIFGNAQSVDPVFLQKQWDASWISVPDTDPQTYGVYLFRQSFNVSDVPETFIVYVSGDNRYKLYVNEVLVSLGPARCDLEHWNFEIVDLAPYLKPGQNIVASQVWNDGANKAEAQISFKTGFVLQGATAESAILNTNNTWKCIQDKSYSIPQSGGSGWNAIPPNEQIDMGMHIINWQKLSYDDSSWQQAQGGVQGGFAGRGGATPKNTVGIDAQETWRLVPSSLPQMELTNQRLIELRKAEGVTVSSSFPAELAAITIPENTTATLLLDQTFLTNAYPTLIFSDGNSSTISITYAESLYEVDSSSSSRGRSKNNRNEVEGKTMRGNTDIIISDGSSKQNFTSLWFRTYRYVELKIETKDSPLVIEDFYGTFTGYPLKLDAKLETENAELNKMMEIGWRSVRLCAVETYFDCPYYEQLQYIGDTRIQAMVTLYNTNDDRLVKNALNWFDLSRKPEGNTLSRYPTRNPQMIPTFSLWYIGMLHDYMMYGSDREFIKNKLPGERMILDYFTEFQDDEGSLINIPNWTFVDWAANWQRGNPPKGEDGSSAVLDLQLILAYQYAADMELSMGMLNYVDLYNAKIENLSKTIKDKYWDESSKLFADTPEKDKFSQHANSMAILAGLVEGEDAFELAKLILSDTTLTQATIYFKYYLHQALVKAGLGDDYLNWLDIWRKNIDLGLTTWGETSQVESTRSDCHAWGSSPNIEFFRTVLGIDSDSPFFEKVKIEPHLGSIKEIAGEIPHPQGTVFVSYDHSGKTLKAEIKLPGNIGGVFIWNGVTHDLHGGSNTLNL